LIAALSILRSNSPTSVTDLSQQGQQHGSKANEYAYLPF
jgi:hypothetical protein